MVGNLFVVDKVNNVDFFCWKLFFFGGIDFCLELMMINVGEIVLFDFYFKLIFNEFGCFNLQDIVRKLEVGVVLVVMFVDKLVVSKVFLVKLLFLIKIVKVILQNGMINFLDFFVKLNYMVNVMKLGGCIIGLFLVVNMVVDFDLCGSYVKLVLVQIQGKFNLLVVKFYFDLKVEVKGVDLVGFLLYLGKYVGYSIEKGKFLFNFVYKLEDNVLIVDNKVFIDQFIFGDVVDSLDVIKLFVNLVILLFKNNWGEIDFNLLIFGLLDDLQFFIGGLIFKVIVNFFVKVVIFFFVLFGLMFGGGEELLNVEFVVGWVGVN